MAKVMGKADRFSKFLIQPQRGRDRSGDLCDLDGMGQASAKIVALMLHKNLRFMLETSKRGGVNDPVTVALERAAMARSVLHNAPPPAFCRIRGIFCPHQMLSCLVVGRSAP